MSKVENQCCSEITKEDGKSKLVALGLSLTLLLLTTNIIAVSIIVVISFAVAIETFRKGLDPDNFVISIESSLADGITTVALLVALFLIGY